MGLEHLPADLIIHDRVGKPMIRSNIERGDTVTFVYTGERRVVLVLENDGRHLKGIDKLRNGDYRNFLLSKIGSVQYAKPFVKQNVAVTYEMLPDLTNTVKAIQDRHNLSFIFTNKKGEECRVYGYNDGRLGLNCPNPKVCESDVTPELFVDTLTKFLAE